MSDFLYKIYNVSRPQQVRKRSVQEKLHVCRQCPYKVKSSFLMNNHVKQHHSISNSLDLFTCSKNAPELYRCYYCDINTDNLVQFNKHVTQAQPKHPKKVKSLCDYFFCENCNFETYSRLILLKHVYTKCPLYTNNASIMLVRSKPIAIPNKIKLIYGKQTPVKIPNTKLPEKVQQLPRIGCKEKSERKWLKCDQCPFQTQWGGSFRDHTVLKHTALDAIDWFKCEQCSYKAKIKYYLAAHMLKEHSVSDNVKCYRCPDCSFKAIWKHNLDRHFRNVHALNEEVCWFQCKQCPYKSKSKSHFRRHVKEQHTISEEFSWFQCDHCPYRAKQKIHMKLHTVQRHTALEDIQWYECGHCSYKAKIKASLKNHILKKHTSSEKIDWFVCEKCGFKVLERSLLKKHMLKMHI